MKPLNRFFSSIVVFLAILAACSPQSPSTQLPPPPSPGAQPPPAQPSASQPPVSQPSAAASAQPVSLPAPQAGTVMLWMDGSQLVFVPGGEFVMGADGQDNPKHTVTLSDYWIQRTEVTNREYALCIKLGQCTAPQDAQAAKDVSDPGLLDHPVVGVNWEQAQAYCGWIKGTLPTEAQWEKAARGTDGRTYPWGEAQPDPKLLNFNNNIGTTSNVADYPDGKSPYSALDMAGNVYEWVADFYQADYYASSPPTDPPGPATGEQRSVRSSSFSSGADQIPVATRFHSAPDASRQDLGFRCVVQDPPSLSPYCQSSGFVTGGPTPTACNPTVSTSYECDRASHPHVGDGVAMVGGASIVSMSVISTSNPSITCRPGHGNEVVCIGPSSGGSAQVQIGVTCSAPPSSGSTGSGGPVLSLACPTGEHHPSGDPIHCVADGAPLGGCPLGFTPTGGGCILVLPPSSGSSSGTPELPCPVGSYRVGDSCVRRGGPPAPGSECLAGFSLDATNGCCQAPDPTSYPGCTPDEGLRLVPAGPDDVGAITSCAPTSGGGGTSTLTVTIPTGACETNPGGNNPNSPSCSSITSDSVCNSTPGCSFNYNTKTCQ